MKFLNKAYFVFMLFALLIIPIASHAATTTVTNEIPPQAALNDSNTDTIIVSNSIQVSNTVTLPNDNRTINIQADPANNVVTSANGTNYIFNYATTSNNLNINFEANLLMYEPNSQDLVQNLPPNVYSQTDPKVIISEQTPVKVGYAFAGLNTALHGSETQYRAGDSFIMHDERVALFAQLQSVFFTLAFDANTSDPVENLPSSINYTVGETITIPNQTPIRTGYTFVGWNTNSDGSGTQYGPGDSFVGFEQDSTLYAQWTLNPVNLVYDANTTDVVENLPQTESYIPGEIATISEQIPTRNGYTFTGWNSKSDGTGIAFNPGESVLIPDNGLILYAQWMQNQNNLNFDPNTTDSVDNLPEDISYTPGYTITIPNEIPTRDGYNFIGWNTSADGTGTSYQPGESFTAPEGNLTLYAQWEEDNNPILIWIILGLLFTLIFVCIILFSLCYVDCNC